MKKLKKMNFKELSSSEMKQVKGGGLLGDLLKDVGKVVDDVILVVGPIVTAPIG